MDLTAIKEKLSSYKKDTIIITKHAELQAAIRDIDLEDVKANILNPIKLVYAKKQESQKQDEEKYDCYFVYSKHLYHRYIIVFNGKVIIVTIIKINRDWQKSIG